MEFNIVEFSVLFGSISALIGALIAWKKINPEEDSLIITQAQGAAQIYDNLVKSLYAEIDRLNSELRRIRDERDRLRTKLYVRMNDDDIQNKG